MLSLSESDAEELGKKVKFFEELHGKLSAADLNRYNNLHRRFRNRISKIWELKGQVEKIEGQREILKKEQRKTFVFFMTAAVLLLLIKLYQASDLTESLRLLKIDLDFSFIFLAGFIYYLWISTLNKMSDQNMSLNISNTNMTASIIEMAYTDLNLLNFPNFAIYMKIYDEERYGRELSSEELHIIDDFNVQLGLAVLESMGYKIPIRWD